MHAGLSLDDIRDEARRITRSSFAARHPEPILLARATLEGDLQFADAGEAIALPRSGNTLVHIPRLTAAERFAEPPGTDEKPVDPSWYFPLRAEGPEPMLSIGRLRGNELRIQDWTISAVHARISVVPGTARASVKDAGSRNGTLHNGARLPAMGSSELVSGDMVQIGRWIFVFLDADDFWRFLVGELDRG